VLGGGYAPTVTEINISWFPIDQYASSSPQNGTIPSCPSSYTVRQCLAYFFNNNPNNGWPYNSNNYVGQGVTGVRFIFALQGSSTSPWDQHGNVQAAWVQNFQTFLSDLRGYGITRVTPTPALDGGTFQSSSTNDCTGTRQLFFLPWMPFGYVQVSVNPPNYYPDCQGVSNGYNIAARNPNFWGWAPFFNLWNQVIKAVAGSGLQLGEIDLDNEVNLTDFTVGARLIYDNTTNTDVLSGVRYYLSCYSLSPWLVTFSTTGSNPNVAGFDCGSVYGDSAMILHESSLTAAYAGGGAVFGEPNVGATYNLVCGGNTNGMISLPVSYTQPQVTDIHIKPCVISASTGNCDTTQDATSTATAVYSDFWSFLTYRGFTANTAMMGETQSGQNCDGYTAAMATQNVNGYEASTLFANHASLTTMRPWENPIYPGGLCYVAPNVINPPYDSQ
jgi:hypothetical protein